jgi:hypothetical protein
MLMLRDPIVATPNKQGPVGKAWTIDVPAVLTSLGIDRPDAALVSWLIEAPWAHPVWHSYNLVLVHLRPVDGMEPPKVYRAGGTHEFWLYALDPEEPREALLTRSRVRWLYPANFAAQLVEADDEAAIARVDEAVDLIVRGYLNPDSGAMRQWVNLFGDAMLREEYRR